MTKTLLKHLAKYIGISFICAALLLQFGTVSAQGEDSISQSFHAEGELATGSLVSLKAGNPGSVEPSNFSTSSNLVGIVAKNPLVELSKDNASVKVVTSGITEALVSDINGDVKIGDKITASPIAGVGMATTEPMQVVGTAQANLKDVELKEHSVTDKRGRTETVKIGRVPVLVQVTFYANAVNQNSFLPPFIQDVANSIAGQPVSPVRIIAGLLLLILSIVSVSILLFTSVRSSIISIGRNPLSEESIHKSLVVIGVMVIGILLLTTGAVYLILVT